jgi:hypothetical protein
MTGDLDSRLFDVAAAIGESLEAGATIDVAALAERFGVAAGEVERVAAALGAVQQALGEDLAAAAALAPPVLPDDYELGPELGRGGMGIVYRAHQKSLDRDVAVKVLRPGDLVFGASIARFEREAKSLARLRHRHIVSVHEVGRANGHVYFTMDLVEGKSLQRAIADGEMTTTRAVKLVRQICSAMVYAHQKGVVHRDLKPANVLVDGDDDAFVCDFGLARDLGAAGDATLSGMLVGTPAYMSPEQALADHARIGEASDVYAIGAILYECLAGRPPFHGLPLARLMQAVVDDEPEPLRQRNPRVPRDLAVICGKAMQKRIADRYATVQALAEDLERFAIGKAILARPQPWLLRGLRSLRRHRGSLLVGSGALAAVLAAMWWFVVPDLLRSHRLELGDRLFAEGNADGARLAYADAGLRLPGPGAEPEERCTNFATCLVDEAGEALAAGRVDRALALVEQARALLPSVSQLRITFGQPDPARLGLRADARYAREKADAVAGAGDFVDLPRADWQPRLHRDLAGSAPQAAALLAARLVEDSPDAFEALGDQRAIWIRELLHLRGNLPAPQQQRITRLCRGHSQMALAFTDVRFEAALVALVQDRGLAVEARKDAAALLHRFGRFPFVRAQVRHDHANGFDHLLVVRDEDLAEVTARYESLRGLDRAAAYDRCIDFVVETMSRPMSTGVDPDSLHVEQRNWLEEHAGARLRPGELALDFWARQRQREPRTRLLAALGWDLSPEQLTPALLLQKLHAPEKRSSGDWQPWLHHLLALTVDESVPVPFHSPVSGDLVARWERALQAIPGERYTLRVATIGFVDGSPTPRLLWQKEMSLGIDETVHWNECAAPDLGAPGHRLQFGRVPPLPGTLTSLGRAHLRWTKDGVRGDIPQADAFVLSRDAYDHGHYGGDNDLVPGFVTFADGGSCASRDGQWHLDFVTLAHLAPQTEPVPSWTVGDWQRELGTTLTALANGESHAAVNHLPIFAASAFLPQPAQREVMVQIEGLLRRVPASAATIFREERRRARLLAGDVDALQVPIAPAFGEPTQDTAPIGRLGFWVRLALSTDVPTLRDHAFAQLSAVDLPPAFARTIAAAADAGSPVPAGLVERVRAAPSAAAAFVNDNLARLGALLAIVVANVSFLVAALRRRGRATAAGAFFAALLLSQIDLQWSGVSLLPAWIGYSLTVVAIWIACWRIVPGILWWLLPLWWTVLAPVGALSQLDRADMAAVLSVTFALFLAIRWQLWRRAVEVRRSYWERRRQRAQ